MYLYQSAAFLLLALPTLSVTWPSFNICVCFKTAVKYVLLLQTWRNVQSNFPLFDAHSEEDLKKAFIFVQCKDILTPDISGKDLFDEDLADVSPT
jgi:hypothetical protein